MYSFPCDLDVLSCLYVFEYTIGASHAGELMDVYMHIGKLTGAKTAAII